MSKAYKSIAAVTITTYVVCAVYCLAVAPLLEPAPKRRPQAAAPETSLTSTEGGDPFADLFPVDSWQRRHPFTLQTDRGSVLFGDYRMGASGEVEVKPVSLVVRGGASGGRPGRVYLLDAPDGAILRFENGLDLSKNSSGLGKLLYARLLGPVEIESPPTSPTAEDGIYIATRGIQIDQTSINTAQTIEMHFGPHRLMGRDLKLRFLNPEQKLKTTGMSSWAFSDLEITQVDLVQFMVGGEGIALFGGSAAEVRAGPADASPIASTPIEIRCQGRFKIDFLTREASFRDQVEVLRLPARGEADSLRCDLLSLSLDAEEGAGLSGSRLDRFAPSRLTAVGRPVVLTSPSADVSAKCEEMEYWIESRKIVLRDAQRVTLTRGTSEFRSPSIEYVLAKEPRRLGRLHAKGRGELIAVDPRFPRRSMRAEWDQELKLEPEGSLHRLEMRTGAALFLAGDQQRFRAREMKLWLEELGAPAAVARRRPAPSRNRRAAWQEEEELPPPQRPRAAGAAPAMLIEVRPRRMLAIGSVEADTPELKGATQRMELIFNYPDSKGTESNGPAVAGPAPAGGGDAQRRPNSGIGRQEAPPEAKYDLVGDFIKVEIDSEGNSEPTIREVTVHKNLRFERFDLTDPTAPPLRVSGDQFKLTGGIRGDAEVVISGAPAEVSAEDISITGPEIHLQQRRNRVYIDQPGKVVIRDLARALAANAPEGETAALGQSMSAKLIEVAWRGRMEFDGKKVAFEREVVANLLLADRDGVENELEILSGSLELYLNRPVSFGSRAQLPEDRYGEKLGLDRLVFDGGVDITTDAFDTRDRRTAFDQLHARNLSYDHVSGGFKADGPGYVSSVRRGMSAGAALTSPLGRPGDARGARASQSGLSYLRVDFDGAITGNLLERDLMFDRRVQAVYSPVESWEDVVDPNVKGGLGEEGLALQAEEMSIFQVGEPSAKAEAAFEFEARGNVMIEGSRFLAYGARTSYAPAKHLVLLEGSPRKDCEIHKLNEQGVEEFKQAAGRMLYRTDTREIQIQNVGQGQVFETPQMRLPATGGAPTGGAPAGGAPRPGGAIRPGTGPGAGPPKPSIYRPGQR